MGYLHFWRAVVWSRVWWAMLLLIGAMSNAQQFKDSFLPARFQGPFRPLDILPAWSWETWAIIALAISLFMGITRSYRLYRKALSDGETERLALKRSIPQLVEDTRKSLVRGTPISLAVVPKCYEHPGAAEGVVHVRNICKEPVRVTAIARLTERNVPIVAKDRPYLVKWQGLATEEKDLWPNEEGTLCVCTFARLWKLGNAVALVFHTSTRQKAVFGVQWYVDNFFEAITSYREYQRGLHKGKSVTVTVDISAVSVSDPNKTWADELVLQIHTGDKLGQLGFVVEEKA